MLVFCVVLKLTDKVGYRLEGLLLAHDKADALLLSVAH